MWPFLGSLFTGAMGLFGMSKSADTSASNNAANIQMQQQTNQMQMEEAQRNRDFQMDMSNTAFQRASEDAQRAGLNPMMMFGSGGPASTPAGGQASFTAPQARENPGKAFERMGDVADKVVNSAVAAKTFEKMTDEIGRIQADSARIKAEEANIQQRTKTEEQHTFIGQQENTRRALTMPANRVAAKEAEAKEKLPSWLFDLLNQSSYSGGHASQAIRPLADVISSAKDVGRLLPSRSTSQRSRVDSDGKSFDEFWENRTGWNR